ncbi:MAG: hypothetical protein KI792_02480 [Alphaproteobacteria bacterium]|nr:hypothetical protein [Alphaproteobacteria bacterium SS10]
MLPGVNRELAACFQDDLDDLHAANDIFDEEQRRAVCVPFLERLSAEIRVESSRFDRMIVSSEHFHSRFRSEKSISALAGFLNAHFTSIRVVCYLREQSDARLSLYSTALKSGSPLGLVEFNQRLSDLGLDTVYYDYKASLDRWAAVFGRENLLVRRYGAQWLEWGDSRRDFLRHALGMADEAGFNFSTKVQNKKLTADQAKVLRLYNRRQSSGGQAPVVSADVMDAILSNPLLLGGVLSDPGAVEFANQFVAGNRDLSRDYMDGEPLFSPTSADQTASASGAPRLISDEQASEIVDRLELIDAFDQSSN